MAAVLPMMGVVLLIPIVPRLASEFAGTLGVRYLIPLMLTLPALFMALMSPLVGAASDRFGRKPLLVGALALYTGFGTLPIFLHNLVPIVIARGFLGVTEAAIMTIATALLGDYFEGERLHRWIAMQIGVVSLSAIVITGLGGMLAEILGTRGPFLAYLLAVPLAAACAYILFEPVAYRRSKNKAARLPVLQFAGLLALTFGAGLIFYTLFLQLGPVIVAVGVTSPGMIGLAAALANIGNAAGAVAFRMTERRYSRFILGSGCALAALGYLGATLAKSFSGVTAAAIVASLGAGMLLPALLSRMLDRLSLDQRGRGTGLWNGAFFIAQFLSPLIAASLSALTGSLTLVLELFAGLAAIAAAIAFIGTLRHGGGGHAPNAPPAHS
jgi:MFS family permease